MKYTVFLALMTFVAISAEENFTCQEGGFYVENECNGCFCGANGKMSCTVMACLSPRTTELRNCEVGTTSDKDCNKCWCVKDLGTICTNNPC